MLSNWSVSTLEDVCTKITDGAHNSPPSTKDGMPMASVKDMTNYGVNIDTARIIPLDDFKKLVKQGCQPLKDDILIAKDGATALETVCHQKSDASYVLLSSVAILRPNKKIVYPAFLKYYLQSPTTKNYIKTSYFGGAAIPRVVLKHFKQVKIQFPNLDGQQKIAYLLSAYDDLIENNNRRIQILEEMAQRLYKHWFIDFKFPNHEDTKFIESDLGLIPDGWTVATLKNIVQLTMGSSPKSEFYNENGKGLPFHQGVTNFGIRFPTDKTYCTKETRIANAGDILFSVRAPVGRINIADKKMIIGRGLSAIRHKEEKQVFFYYQLKKIFEKEDSMGSGAIFNAVNKTDLEELIVILPCINIVDQFEELAIPISRQIEGLVYKVENLTKTRDLLLPLLISGELSVEDMEIAA